MSPEHQLGEKFTLSNEPNIRHEKVILTGSRKSGEPLSVAGQLKVPCSLGRFWSSTMFRGRFVGVMISVGAYVIIGGIPCWLCYWIDCLGSR